ERDTLAERGLPEVLRIGRIPVAGDRAARYTRAGVVELHYLPKLARRDLENEAPLSLRVRYGLCDHLRQRPASRFAAVHFERGFVRHRRHRDAGGGPVVQHEPPCHLARQDWPSV